MFISEKYSGLHNKENFDVNYFVACAICGVLCISLPIPIIVNNFNKFYEKAKIEEEIEAKRKRTSWEDAKRGERYKTAFLLFLSYGL